MRDGAAWLQSTVARSDSVPTLSDTTIRLCGRAIRPNSSAPRSAAIFWTDTTSQCRIGEEISLYAMAVDVGEPATLIHRSHAEPAFPTGATAMCTVLIRSARYYVSSPQRRRYGWSAAILADGRTCRCAGQFSNRSGVSILGELARNAGLESGCPLYRVTRRVRTNVVDIAVANMPADRRESAGLDARNACHNGVPDRIVTSRSGDARRRGRGGIGVLHGVAGKLAALGRRRDGDPRDLGGAGSHPHSQRALGAASPRQPCHRGTQHQTQASHSALQADQAPGADRSSGVRPGSAAGGRGIFAPKPACRTKSRWKR